MSKQASPKQEQENHATRFAYHVAHNLQGLRHDETETECVTRVNRAYSAFIREYESGGTGSLYIAAIALAASAARLAIVRSPRAERETLTLQGTCAADASDSKGTVDAEQRANDLIKRYLDIHDHSCSGCGGDECGVGSAHLELVEEMRTFAGK